MSVAVLLDNFVTASMRMDDEERAQRYDEGLGGSGEVGTEILGGKGRISYIQRRKDRKTAGESKGVTMR